jgi:hypothetical protein
MKIIIFFIILFSEAIYSQNLSVSIEINKTEFHRYNREGNDSMIVTTRIKNISGNTVLLRLANGLDINYIGENGTSNGHCFRVYSLEKFENQVKPDYQRTFESFVEIMPGEEIVQTGKYYVAWICRGGPPYTPWKFELLYNRIITSEDNYYMFKSNYSDKYYKEPVEAWTGILKSNSIEIIIGYN